MNCQLEAAGIAGTCTPSEAASNYQLGWFSVLLEPGNGRARRLAARCGI
jgi:hypothetical protein